ncbi:MAG: tetratricopeptide (TPR) repeat protein, partial [Cognaticolwellia sp.]
MLSALPLGLLLLGGAILPEPPVIAPGSVPTAQASLAEGIALHKRGDSAAAVTALEGWLVSSAGPYGRERSAGRFLLGWLYMDQGKWNLASAQFTSVRVANGPLAMHGAWYEAWTDHQRGRHTVAAGECATYRTKWPEGPHAEECLVLRGDALVAAGQKSGAIAAYKEYLELNPDTPRAEELRLGMALAEANANPERGAMLLKTLTVNFEHPCSAVAAQAALDALLEEEDLEAPSLGAVREAQLRAVSLRDCGLKDEAMSLYKEIGAQNPDDAQVQAWQAAQGGTFAWRTKQYRALGDSFARNYKAKPNSEDAWYAFRAYFRGGYFKESAEFGELGLEKHSKSGRFRNVRDVVAHTQQMAGNYERAREHWEVLAKGRGSVATAAAWFAAFDTYRMGEYEAAIARMDPIVAKGGETGLSARYYRGKSYSALKDRDKAAEDYSWIRRNASNTWYALLLNSKWRKGLADMPPELLRQGR